ncbi:MAG: 50S ribosomal protein L10 [Actinomycetota bacterium]|nr:50S ribosomal protein L10 [Actinomycetota bacterium]
MAETRTAEPSAEKKAEVQEITARFKDNDAVLLTEYRGLRVAEIREVRQALRAADSDYKVLKNSLARLAVREVGLEDLAALLEGPTAIAFVKGDVAAAAKALDEAVKKYPVLTIKGGVLNGKVLDAAQAQALAKLESREVLLTKIAMLFNQPAQQTVNAFAALLRDLGSMLGQVLAQKESEAPAADAEIAPAAETTPAAPPGDATLDQPEVDEAEKAEEAAAADESTSAGDETEAAAETSDAETPAEEAAVEAEPPAELAEAVDQAPAAPESEAAETQETDKTQKEEE